MIRLRPLALVGALALLPDALLAQATRQAPRATQPLKHRARPTSAPISEADLRTRVYVFADDSMMGREAGSPGALKGTAYIAAELRRLGLRPAGENGSFFQTVPFVSRTLDSSTSLAVNGARLVPFTDFVALPFRGGLPRALDGVQVIYGGVVGDTTQPLTAEQTTGKLVIMRSAPGQTLRVAAESPLAAAAAVAVEAGAELSASYLATGRAPSLTLPPAPNAPSVRMSLYVTRSAAERLLGASMEGMAVGTAGARVQGNLRFVERTLPTRNVIALLPGTDRSLRGQYVAVGAHSDHVGYSVTGAVDHDSLRLFNAQRFLATENPTGAPIPAARRAEIAAQVAAIRINVDSLRKIRPARRDSINNGADDDGSGSMTVLELAEAFARGPVKPKRSLLFVWHTAEERGLLGARYFSDNPTVPRDSIVAQINLDMVGRGGAGDLGAGGERYLQLVGSRRLSTELGDLTEEVNRSEPMPFTFDYTFDANGHPDNIYCRSDHYHYARYGIPVVFITSGLHGDYHQVTDESQYINYPRLARVARFAFNLTSRVAGLDHRPVVDKPKPDPNGACRQ